MANRTLTMNKIKQILRGHIEGHGSKQLSKLTGVSSYHQLGVTLNREKGVNFIIFCIIVTMYQMTHN